MILSVTLNPCVDHALFLDRLALGDTNRVQRTETDAGGKGVNLSRVAAEMGARTLATGFLGGGAGAYVRHVLDREGVPHSFVEIEGETRTNFSVEDESGAPPTTYNARGPEISAVEWAALLDRVQSVLPETSWLALGGSAPPGVPTDAFTQIAALGNRHGVRVLLDSDGDQMARSLDSGISMVKPNAKEASRLLGYAVETLDDACHAAQDLFERLSAVRGDDTALAIVSRGKDGAVLACSEGLFEGLSPRVEPHSTIGSGDSLLGAMLARLVAGDGPPYALRWGLAAGAATATTDGSQIGRRAVIELLWAEASVRRV